MSDQRNRVIGPLKQISKADIGSWR